MASNQPIVRGIQAVGSVEVLYKYNSADGILPIPSNLFKGIGTQIDTGNGGVAVAGFRLDSEFLRANPQIATSIVVPILGGGGVALTNNNRSGTLVLNCSKVSTPYDNGSMQGNGEYYDMVILAQIQQGQTGGDSVGADITIKFNFCGKETDITFESCTVAAIDPLGLAGNDIVNYNVAFNYLNWYVEYIDTDSAPSPNSQQGG